MKNTGLNIWIFFLPWKNATQVLTGRSFLLVNRNLATRPIIDWFVDWLIDWLINWLIEWVSEWLIDLLIDRSIDRLIDWTIDGLIVRFTVCLIDWNKVSYFDFRSNLSPKICTASASEKSVSVPENKVLPSTLFRCQLLHANSTIIIVFLLCFSKGWYRWHNWSCPVWRKRKANSLATGHP